MYLEAEWPLFLLEKVLFWAVKNPSKIEVELGLQVYIYTHIFPPIFTIFTFQPTFHQQQSPTVHWCQKDTYSLYWGMVIQPLIGNPGILIKGPYKPLRTWIDFPIPYYMVQ